MDLVPKRLVLLLLTKIEVLDPEKVGTNPALQCSQERERVAKQPTQQEHEGEEAGQGTCVRQGWSVQEWV